MPTKKKAPAKKPEPKQAETDRLIIRRRGIERLDGRHVISIPMTAYVKLSEIAALSGLRVGEVVERILDYAIERIEIVD